MNVTTTIEGRQRFSVNVRFAQDFRDKIEKLKRLQLQTMNYGPIPLSAVADVSVSDGPPMINTENAMLRGTLLFNVRDRDLGSGPGKLCQALGIGAAHYGVDLTRRASAVRIVDDGVAPPTAPVVTRRVGLTVGVEQPWRWYVASDVHVSRK